VTTLVVVPIVALNQPHSRHTVAAPSHTSKAVPVTPPTTSTTFIVIPPAPSTSTDTSTSPSTPQTGVPPPASSISAATPPFAPRTPVGLLPPRTVTVVGDSITYRSRAQIETALSPEYRVTLDSRSGSHIAQWLPTIEEIIRTTARHDWVIELGTNDLLTPAWASPLAQEIKDLRHQRCVIFVTVDPRVVPQAETFDAALAAAVAMHPHLHILDWGDIEWDNPTWLEPDEIHPTPAGSAELAHLEAQSLNMDCN
jgi:hypothetical protein